MYTIFADNCEYMFTSFKEDTYMNDNFYLNFTQKSGMLGLVACHIFLKNRILLFLLLYLQLSYFLTSSDCYGCTNNY